MSDYLNHMNHWFVNLFYFVKLFLSVLKNTRDKYKKVETITKTQLNTFNH